MNVSVGPNPPASVSVFFYKNAVNKQVGGNMPGALVKRQVRPYTNFNGVFLISGITGVTLPAGHYWVSVQFNGKSIFTSWETRTAQNGSPAVFENPGNALGTGCTTWYNSQTCLGYSGVPDLMFGLYGSSKS